MIALTSTCNHGTISLCYILVLKHSEVESRVLKENRQWVHSLALRKLPRLLGAVNVLYPQIDVFLVRGRDWYRLSLKYEGKTALDQAVTLEATLEAVVAFVSHCTPAA